MTYAGKLRKNGNPNIKIGDFGCGPDNLLVDYLKTSKGSTEGMKEGQTIESLLQERSQSDPGFASLTDWKGFEVISVDHINYGRKDIQACDMGDFERLKDIITPSSTPSRLDLAVFSLSIKGDYKDYLHNAKELLREGGTVFIALPADSWWNRREGDQGEGLESSKLGEMINYLTEELGFKQPTRAVGDIVANCGDVNIYQDVDRRFIYLMLTKGSD